MNDRLFIRYNILLCSLIIIFINTYDYLYSSPGCSLCHIQRSFYYLILIISIYLNYTKQSRIIIITAILYCINLLFSSYHILIENQLIVESSFCKINITDFTNIDEMIELPKTHSCANSFKLFYINFSVWNFIINLASISLYIALLKFKIRNAK